MCRPLATLLSAVALFHLSSVVDAVDCLCKPHLPVLDAFLTATGGSTWSPVQWDLGAADAPCGWKGLTCDGDGSIVKIELPRNNLSGTLPSSLGSLSNLTVLDLTANALLGGSLPESYASWGHSIMVVLVSDTDLTGTLPPAYASWRSVKNIDLSHNVRLSGTLPPAYGQWTHIVTLWLKNCSFTGSLPAAYATWSSLKEINVEMNLLTGTLPAEYFNWSSIQLFRCLHNKLSGNIPSEWSAWTKMNHFDGSNNSLSGTIPVFTQWGSTIERFRVSENELSGTLHNAWQQWTRIEELALETNRLTGTIPDTWGAAMKKWIRYFRVENNLLSGTLPSELAQWSNLTFLSASNNTLSGTLPASFVSLTKLATLILSSNAFVGTIPDQWGVGMQAMQVLAVDDNQLTGSIPASIAHMTNLFALVLSFNKLSGTLPAAFGTQWRWSVGLIGLQNNSDLTGIIPTEWSSIYVPFVSFMSTCGTKLCGTSASLRLGFPFQCFQNGALHRILYSDGTDRLPSLVATVTGAISTSQRAPCSSSPPPPTTQSQPPPRDGNTMQRGGPVQPALGAATVGGYILASLVGGGSSHGFSFLQNANGANLLSQRCALLSEGLEADPPMTEVIDHPLQFTLEVVYGSFVGPSAAAVVGNTALILVCGIVLHVGSVALATRVQCKLTASCGNSFCRTLLNAMFGADLLPGTCATVLGMFFQPTISALIIVVMGDGASSAARWGLVAPILLCWCCGVVKVVHVVLKNTAAHPSPEARVKFHYIKVGKSDDRRRQRSRGPCTHLQRWLKMAKQWLMHSKGEWAAPRRRLPHPSQRPADAPAMFFKMYGAFFNSLTGSRVWWFVFDWSCFVAAGVALGVAQSLEDAEAACAAAIWGPWVLSAVVAVQCGACGWCQPMCTRIDAVTYLSLGVLSLGGCVAAAVDQLTLSGVLCNVCFALALCLAVLTLLIDLHDDTTRRRRLSRTTVSVPGEESAAKTASTTALSLPVSSSSAADVRGRQRRRSTSTTSLNPTTRLELNQLESKSPSVCLANLVSAICIARAPAPVRGSQK